MLKKQKLIEVALGEKKADLVIKNAQLVNVLTEEIYDAEVAVVAGRVAGVGKGYEGEVEVDLKGAYLTPGFIDGHTHHFDTVEEGVNYLKNNITPQITLFLKASRSMKFENIISGLS